MRMSLAALRWRERTHNVYRWAEEFVRTTAAAPVAIQPLSPSDFEVWLGVRLANYHAAIFLDYDGTLAPIRDHPAEAELPPATRRALQACVAHPEVDVSIVSGRALEDLRATVAIPGLVYAANHGFDIAIPGEPVFHHPEVRHFTAKLLALAAELDAFAAAGAWIERKGATLTVHVRGVEPSQRAAVLVEARALIATAGFQPRDGLWAVEARPPIAWDKGQAVLYILRQLYGPSWSERVRVVYLGDDHTDEDAFRVLAGLGTTFRVGPVDALTLADRHLPSVEAVGALLEWLAARPVQARAASAGPH
jgi:trehalose 6-phosphate synthase/phosphatase